MYALIVPASTPFILLATVMALSWWEDRVLPSPPPLPDPSPSPSSLPAQPAEAAAEVPLITR